MLILKYILPLIVILLLVLWWSARRAVSDDFVRISIAGQVHRVLLADELAEWQSGLSGRSDKAMMLFVFPDKQVRNFWMKDMFYPISIVWIEEDTVVGVDRGELSDPLQSDGAWPRYSSPRPVDKVLEIPVDFSQEFGLNIEIGDKINIL